jgi:hypothetical protein
MADDDALALSVDAAFFVQRFVIATLYFAFAGEDWRYSANFLTADSECTWFEDRGGRPVGVTCAETGQVVSIDLCESPDELEMISLFVAIILTPCILCSRQQIKWHTPGRNRSIGIVGDH